MVSCPSTKIDLKNKKKAKPITEPATRPRTEPGPWSRPCVIDPHATAVDLPIAAVNPPAATVVLHRMLPRDLQEWNRLRVRAHASSGVKEREREWPLLIFRTTASTSHLRQDGHPRAPPPPPCRPRQASRRLHSVCEMWREGERGGGGRLWVKRDTETAWVVERKPKASVIFCQKLMGC